METSRIETSSASAREEDGNTEGFSKLGETVKTIRMRPDERRKGRGRLYLILFWDTTCTRVLVALISTNEVFPGKTFCIPTYRVEIAMEKVVYTVRVL